MTDIFAIKPSNREVQIKHPGTGKPIGFTVSLRPLTSPEVQEVVRKQQDRRLQLAARNKSFTAEDMEANGVELIVSAITGWTYQAEDMTIDGEQPAFRTDIAAGLLTKAPWIFQQLDEALGDTSRFFQ